MTDNKQDGTWGNPIYETNVIRGLKNGDEWAIEAACEYFARHRTRALEASQAAEVTRLREAIGTLSKAIDKARNLVPDDEEGLAAYIFSNHINAAQRACERAARATPTRIEAVQPQEAVAWMYELFDMKEVHMQRLPGRISWKETPLYATPPQAAESGLLEAMGRQCDNMAFVLNNVTLPGQWYGKFSRELAEDRALLAQASRMAELEGEVARLKEAAQELNQWANAYPVSAFKEPDLDKVKTLLAEAGELAQMDRMHASWARHILSSVRKITDTALGRDGDG